MGASNAVDAFLPGALNEVVLDRVQSEPGLGEAEAGDDGVGVARTMATVPPMLTASAMLRESRDWMAPLNRCLTFPTRWWMRYYLTGSGRLSRHPRLV